MKRRRGGVELAGFLESAVGAGEGARRYLSALRAVGVPVRAREVELPGRDRARSPVTDAPRWRSRRARVNLICLNPEQLVPYLASAAAPRRRGRRTVAAWSWEVDMLPPGWDEASRSVAEVWACSEFSAKRIRAGVSAPVLAFHHPLAPACGAPRQLAPPPDLPAGFRVLVMFDYLSTIQRKNPIAAIEAFRQAVAPGDGAQLIVKSLNGVHRPEARAQVERAAAGRRDIVLIDGTVSEPERDALVGACDCLLSLHRSEGFGLALAEAMAAGKPVIATRFGGNTEFMSEENSYLVGFEPVLVGPDCEHYPADATWAEPNAADAVSALRSVLDDAAEAGRRAALARSDVLAQLAPARIGQQMAERLSVLC